MLIRNADVFTKSGQFTRTDVLFDSRIKAVGKTYTGGSEASGKPETVGPGLAVKGMTGADDKDVIDASGCLLIPGLVDIHTHGAMGADTCDASCEGLAKMSGFYADNGITSFCATTMTLDEDRLTSAMKCAGSFTFENGAKCTGIYMEGPFINPAKKGAQIALYIVPPDIAMFRRLNDASGGKILVTALAPELPGSMQFIKEASGTCVVALAHSTADYDTAVSAFKCGASQVTHLFNAMEPFLHRSPGIVGAAADTAGVMPEVICDGIHMHPAVIRAAFRLFGEDRICLISDSMRCAGLSDGDYDLGGQEVLVRGGKATLKDGTIAGSSINVMTAVRKAIEFGIRPEAALKAATINPAHAIRKAAEIGAIAPGYYADLVLLDRKWNILRVYVNGREIRRNG